MDEISMFKGYLRSLIRLLKNVKKAADENNIEEVRRLVNELIEDTQKNIED